MKKYKGVPSAGGIACAAVVKASACTEQAAPKTLDQAVEACAAKMQALYGKTLEELGEENAEIFSVYEALLRDEYLLQPVRDRHQGGMELTEAVKVSIEEQASVFAKAKSEYMRQRAEDIRNVGDMLVQEIQGKSTGFSLPEGEEPVIVLAQSLSPADTMSLDRKRLAGFVTCFGGATSHVVILAKALGIPAVTGLTEWDEISDGVVLAIDGGTGEVIASPDGPEMEKIREKLRCQEEFAAMIRNMPKGECCTKDGCPVHVSINISGCADLEGADLSSLYGVGLYRTEFLFVERDKAPTLQEQIAEYRKVFQSLPGKDLIVRTLDIGGDKGVPYLEVPAEENPFLGCRGIRLCFAREELLRTQFEALMRAAEGRPFSVMFPMINDAPEFEKAKKIWQEVQSQLDVPVSDQIRLGVMIETPSALLCADILAGHVDFASIGTNDLTQYILAADRGNSRTGIRQSVYAPAVVRAIYHVIRTFRQADVKISVCGEAGSDLHFLPLMIGMGLQFVSVSPSMADAVRYTVRNTDCAQQQVLLEQALQMQSEPEIRALLNG